MWTTRKLRRNWRGRNQKSVLKCDKKLSMFSLVNFESELGVISELWSNQTRRGSTFLRTAARWIILEIIELSWHSFPIRFERITKSHLIPQYQQTLWYWNVALTIRKSLFCILTTSFSLNANQQALRDKLQRKTIKDKSKSHQYWLSVEVTIIYQSQYIAIVWNKHKSVQNNSRPESTPQ